MRVIVDESAWRDLEGITRRIAADNPLAAHAQVQKVRHIIDQLATFPGLSREGAAKGTRERVVPATNYIVVFELSKKPTAIIVTGIMHAARDR